MAAATCVLALSRHFAHADQLIVANTASSGPGSLPQVVSEARSGDSIAFSLDYPAEILLDLGGPMVIDKNLTITGPGADLLTIKTSLDKSDPGQKIFRISTGAVISISDMTLANAGSYSSGGAIENQGDLTLSRCTLTGNYGLPFGGAIVNFYSGTLLLSHCLVSDNVVGEDSGISQGMGGAIANYGTATIEYSTISGNNQRMVIDSQPDDEIYGGGIYNGGTLEVDYCTIENNSANDGGGIFNTGTLTVTHSTVASNEARYDCDPETGEPMETGNGGGICNEGDLTLVNSTVFYNQADRKGGGIINRGHSSALSMEHATIGENQTGWEDDSQGGGLFSSGEVVFKNSVMADNSAFQYPDCAEDSGAILTSQDYNAIENLGNCVISNAGNDRFGSYLNLPPYYGDNGGPTETLAIYPQYVLANRIPVADSTVSTDQRGAPRPSSPDDYRDIGAYEASEIPWDGGGGTDSWLCQDNWTYDVRPGMGDTALLDSADTVTVQYDETGATTRVGAISMTGAGVTLQQAGYVLVERLYSQSAGIFNGDASDEMATDDFTLSGGDFHAPGELRVSGNFSLDGGNFDANGGTVSFWGSNNKTLAGTIDFYDLVVDLTNDTYAVDASGATVSVENLLNVKKGTLRSASEYHDVQIDADGTLELEGDISVSGDWTNAGEAVLNGYAVFFTGTGTQTLTEIRQMKGTGAFSFLDFGDSPAVVLDDQGQDLGQVSVQVTLNGDCTTEENETFHRCFDIEAASPPASGADLTLYFESDEIPDGQSCEAAEVYSFDNCAWQAIARDTTYGTDGRMCDSEPYSIRVSGVTSLSTFAIKSGDAPAGVPGTGFGWRLYSDESRESVRIAECVLDLNGHNLAVRDDLTVEGGQVNIEGGTLTIGST